VDVVEKEGSGLNLTWEVRQGIVSHSKPKGDFLDRSMTEGLSLEGQTVRISDAVAYLNHDLADSFRAGVLRENDLPQEVVEVLGRRHAQRIDTMVTDIVHESWAASGQDGAPPGGPIITMGTAVRSAVNALRDFMFTNVYIPEDKGEQGMAARGIMRLLYRRYCDHPEEIPQEYRLAHGSGQRAVADWVSGMTDRYAIRVAESLQPGIAKPFQHVFI
jgi:dGTPase